MNLKIRCLPRPGEDRLRLSIRFARPIRSLCTFGAALVLAAGCDDLPTDPAVRPIDGLSRELTATEEALVGAGNSFAFDLLREVNESEVPVKNVFLSPLSASMALGMALNGARGETFEAMRKVLGLSGLDQGEINRSYRTLIDLLLGLDPTVSISIANSAWYDSRLTPKPEFRRSLEAGFDSRFEALDFQDPGAVGTINAWVKEATKGRIPKIIDQVNPLEVMFLVNAIHYKANWTRKFDKKDTGPGTFMVGGNTPRSVDMMRNDEVEFRWAHGPEVSIAEIPYAGGAYGMTVVLPWEGESLDDLVARLDTESWSRWIGLLGDEREGWLALPKFKIEYEAQLKDALVALGMGVAFNRDDADFSGIFDLEVAISRVVQKTFVKVDEEGTEAAAATAVGFRPDSAPPGFAVDRSFLFAIRERFSGTILFIGKVVDPAG